jgi:hypothetical protein
LHLRIAWLTESAMDAALEHAERALALLDPVEAPLDYSFALLTSARVRLHLGSPRITRRSSEGPRCRRPRRSATGT